MYPVGQLDRVVEIADFPSCSFGAPIPTLFADGHNVLLGYYLPSHARAAGADGPVSAVIHFKAALHVFGDPDENSIRNHPLAPRGLEPYMNVEVLDSSWCTQMREICRDIPSHTYRYFDDLRHFVLAFHDEMFECLATGYTVSLSDDTPRTAVLKLAAAL